MYALHNVFRQVLRTLAVAAVATLSISSTASAQSADLVIKVGVGPVDSAAPIIYAAKAGLYKKYGVNVELVKISGGAAIVAALAGGSIDVGESSSLAVVTAIGKGLPFTVIGNLSYYNSELALVVLTNSPIRSAKDLEGKTLASINVSDMNSIATYAWLAQNGVDRNALKYLEVPPAATLAALEQGRIDGAMLFEPFLSTFRDTGKVRILSYPYEAIGKHFSDALFFGDKRWIAEHQDSVSKFLRATEDASVYVAAHESETAQLVGEFTGIEPSTLANIRHAGRGTLMNANDLQPVINVAAKYKVIPTAYRAQEVICSCALRK